MPPVDVAERTQSHVADGYSLCVTFDLPRGRITNSLLVYLAGARLIRSTGLVHRDPYLTGVRKVDVVYFHGTSRKKYRLYTRGRGRTYGYNIYRTGAE